MRDEVAQKTYFTLKLSISSGRDENMSMTSIDAFVMFIVASLLPKA